MSQNPVFPTDNNEEATKTRRTRKNSPENAQSPAQEKKNVRRGRKNASAEGEKEPENAVLEKKHRTVKKAEASQDAAKAEGNAEEKPARRGRRRKIALNTQGEESVIYLGSALVLDDMLPPSSVTVAQEDKAPVQEKKRRGRKRAAAEEISAASEANAEVHAAKDAQMSAAEEKPRTRRNSRRKKEEDNVPAEAEAFAAAYEEKTAEHADSALSSSDMPETAPAAHADGEKTPGGEENLGGKDAPMPAKSMKEEEAFVQTAGNTVPAEENEDNIGNIAPTAKESEPAQWQDDGIVTNVLPYQREFDDVRLSFRSRRNRRNSDAQPVSNASPYLPASYQQNFYDQTQVLIPDNQFGNRKSRGKGKRGNNPPVLPGVFDFNDAMVNDSVLGAAFKRKEEEFFPEDDGPQPAIPDQPVALPASASDMGEEDFAKLDAIANGNRIDMPQIPTQKEGRGKGKNRKFLKEENAEKTVKPEKKAETEEAPRVRRVLYVSVVPDEQVEVVITEDGQVTEYFVEMVHQAKIRGNIYKGIINNIDTNLQAAFVNFGNGKNGFLQIDEVHPEYYLVPHDSSHWPKYPPIQKVLKVGQEVLVQVVKEPSGSKGAFLTTWISIAGRFLVLTPGQEQIGVSRKVEDPEERARLKDLLNGIQPGENMGVIIRTASEGASKASIQNDLQYIEKLWKDIQKKASTEKSPSLIYQEADLATRSVRDYLSEDIVEIWTDDEATKARVEDIARLIFPDRADEIVKLHKDQRQTLWERFNLLRQLETVTSREVVLPSGGRIVFDQTEALMAIDINSGKPQSKSNFEAMVFRTNMEAAEAIARHLRLRDIGGQVVIDFIEMRDKNHCRDVERTLRNAMRKDRARHDVGHMSSFGLLELVRQRTGTSAISISCEPCPHCHGTGMRRNMEWQSLQALRDMQSKLYKAQDNGKMRKSEKASEPSAFIYESDAELALYLLNRKRDRIAALEEKFGTHIEIHLK